MAGTLSIIMMLSTPALAQAQGASDKAQVSLIEQSEIGGSRVKTHGVNIRGLTVDQARKKVKVSFVATPVKVNNYPVKIIARLSAQAQKLGVDLTNLTNDQARTKINAVTRANTLTDLLSQAKTLGINVDKSNKIFTKTNNVF